MTERKRSSARPPRRRRASATKKSFGDRLRQLRKTNGLTQTELGEAVGLSQRMVAFYEGKATNPPASLLLRLADVLHVSLDELLGRGGRNGNEEAPQNLRLWRRLKQVESLPEADRRRVAELVELLVERQQLRRK